MRYAPIPYGLVIRRYWPSLAAISITWLREFPQIDNKTVNANNLGLYMISLRILSVFSPPPF